MPQILLHVRVPGEPYVQKRHRMVRTIKGVRSYDPSSDDKVAFQKQLRLCYPRLTPMMTGRIGIRMRIWTTSWNEDGDNYLKFYMDAMSPPRFKKPQGMQQKLWTKTRTDMIARSFAVWGNDNQLDKWDIEVERGNVQPRVEILVWVIEKKP
jgi:Holliday junction resolvase RusA-like endonuclease